ncbi:tetratricopeptide repeat protein [Lacihabitans soyangensis]|nr:tetratricopeptide repeat protein [Lacihabitans soyangensis]
MKKLILASFVGFTALNASAQADPMKELACKGYVDAVEKGLKNTQNAKQSVKSATWVKLGDAYLDLGRNCTSDSMATQKAYDTYVKALEVEKAAGGKKTKEIEDILKSKALGDGFLQQGAAYYNSKNMVMASKFFGQSSRINDKDSTAALYAGIVDQSLGNNTAAIQSFKTYFANGGKDPAVFYSLAQIYKIEKKFAEAVEILKKGSEIHPNDKDLKNEIINTYISSNNIEGAIIDLEKMVAADGGKNSMNMSNLALLYDSKAQELNNEIQKIRDQVSKGSTADLEKKLASEKDKLSVYEGEIATLTAKMKKEPKTAAATKKRIAEVTSQKVAIEEGIAKISSEIESKKASMSGNSDIAKLPALEAKFKENKDKALSYYKRTLEMDPNNYDANFNLAVLYFNEAVETKKAVDAMDMKTYQTQGGKEIDLKVCQQFAASKPYFDKCKSLKADDDLVLENLKNLERILEQCNK